MSKKKAKYLIWDEEEGTFECYDASSPEDAIKQYSHGANCSDNYDRFVVRVFPLSSAIVKHVTIKAETKVNITITDKKTKA